MDFTAHRAALFQLRRYLQDLEQPYLGFTLGRSPRDREALRLSVLLEATPGEAGLAPHAGGAFRKPGVFAAAELFREAGFGARPVEVVHQGVGRLQDHSLVMPQYHGTYGELRSRVRPFHSGVSVGRQGEPLKGTIGPIVWEPASRRVFALSNNHVLAGGTGTRGGVAVPDEAALPGDDIVQPSIDEAQAAGTDADEIGELFAFVPLRYVGPGDAPEDVNEVDVAMVEVVEPEHRLRAEVPYLGPGGSPMRPTGVVRTLRTDDLLMKVGRSSGLTCGRVIQGGALLRLGYAGGPAVLTGQVIATHMSIPGDSGSLVVNQALEAVGMVVGGSDFVSIITPMPRLLRILREHTGLDLQLWLGEALE